MPNDEEGVITRWRLMELLSYDPGTGVFKWLVSRSRTHAGDVAGRTKYLGYICIGIDGREYYAHRLAWLYMTGSWPSIHIDHRNGIASDNRFRNLREATVSENQQNRAVNKKHTSGLIGACWREEKKKWRARIRIDGRQVFLGYFDTADMAHDAYLAAKRDLHQFQTVPRETMQLGDPA